MNFFNVVSFEEAKSLIKTIVSPHIGKTEIVPIERAFGRRVARTLESPENLPLRNRSTVDGFAVKAADTYGASESVPSLLPLVGTVAMGEVPAFDIKKGQTAAVPTGGALPEGADAAVMVEHTEPFGNDIAVYRPVSVRENVVLAGDDVREKDPVLRRFQKITPMNIGLLAALGFDRIEVVKPLKFAVISTGDEIIEVGRKPVKCQIRDTNTTINAALCQKYGCEVVFEKLIGDDEAELKKALEQSAETADVILVSGGSSVGARDFTREAFASMGKILAHGVSMKPGKPTVIAEIGGKPAIGLPGHPFACLMTLKLLVLDAANELMGDGEPPYTYAIAGGNFPSSPGRTTVIPLGLHDRGGYFEAYPLFAKSGLISKAASADAYALLPDNYEGVEKGEKIKAYLFNA